MASILSDHKYEKRPDREDRLDTLFQIRIAKILRLALPKPGVVRRDVTKPGARKKVYENVPEAKEASISRRTIARLVVLTYIVSGLAKETEDGHLLIVNRSERPTGKKPMRKKLKKGQQGKKLRGKRQIAPNELIVPNVEERLKRAGME